MDRATVTLTYLLMTEIQSNGWIQRLLCSGCSLSVWQFLRVQLELLKIHFDFVSSGLSHKLWHHLQRARVSHTYWVQERPIGRASEEQSVIVAASHVDNVRIKGNLLGRALIVCIANSQLSVIIRTKAVYLSILGPCKREIGSAGDFGDVEIG